jgi:hypothetical protein
MSPILLWLRHAAMRPQLITSPISWAPIFRAASQRYVFLIHLFQSSATSHSYPASAVCGFCVISPLNPRLHIAHFQLMAQSDPCSAESLPFPLDRALGPGPYPPLGLHSCVIVKNGASTWVIALPMPACTFPATFPSHCAMLVSSLLFLRCRASCPRHFTHKFRLVSHTVNSECWLK